MSDYLKSVFETGRKLLTDTKTPRKVTATKGPATKNLAESLDFDPYKVFSRRCISERPQKAEVVKEIERFIKAAEKDL